MYLQTLLALTFVSQKKYFWWYTLIGWGRCLSLSLCISPGRCLSLSFCPCLSVSVALSVFGIGIYLSLSLHLRLSIGLFVRLFLSFFSCVSRYFCIFFSRSMLHACRLCRRSPSSYTDGVGPDAQLLRQPRVRMNLAQADVIDAIEKNTHF